MVIEELASAHDRNIFRPRLRNQHSIKGVFVRSAQATCKQSVID
jgi:hypothetical protein